MKPCKLPNSNYNCKNISSKAVALPIEKPRLQFSYYPIALKKLYITFVFYDKRKYMFVSGSYMNDEAK